jgi:integrase
VIAGAHSIVAQPENALVALAGERSNLIVSAVYVSGEWKVVSKYGDPIWVLTGGTTNTRGGDRNLNFEVVSTCFQEDLKAMLYHYRRSGRRGRSRPTDLGLRKTFITLQPFLRHLGEIGISSFAAVSPEACMAYVEKSRLARRKGRPLALGTLENRFQAVEALYDLSQVLEQPMAHPWPESTARILAGRIGVQNPYLQAAKTLRIPDAAFVTLFQAASRLVEQGARILDLRDGLAAQSGATAYYLWLAKGRYLRASGWSGGEAALISALNDLRSACYIVVASLSGCRNHELGNLKTGACYSTSSRNGERYWWMRSESTKTHEGPCEWLVPTLAVEAVRVMERWAQPYQERLREEIAERRAADPRDVEIAEAERHLDAVFVGLGNSGVRTISVTNWNRLLGIFSKKFQIGWSPKTHQFRRTFAVYAARSQFGDLRYLKQHFKHWCMDMSLLYAANELQELDLLDEIGSELDDIQQGIIAGWLDPDAKLSGGAGKDMTRFREKYPIPIYKDRAQMAKALSEGVHIRSNGHGWCTADNGSSCGGAGALERTRCSTCIHGVIGQSHQKFYSQLHTELKGLLDLTDIGEAGLARVKRDLDRCALVLADLGCVLEGAE